MNPQKRAKEILASFQRYLSNSDKNEVVAYTSEELRSTDEQWCQKDLEAGFRIALRNRIKEIEENNHRQYQSNIRAIGYLVTFAIGVLSTIAVIYLTK